MTTTAVLLFHPHLDASRVNARLAQAARSAGTPERPLEVRDMYGLYPDFRIDVAAEQAVLEACDRIVLQFPMYWYSSPALLKQWEDDVLTYGWAYGSTGKAFAGRKLGIAVSLGAPAADYQHDGDVGHPLPAVLLPFELTARYIGADYRPYYAFHTIDSNAGYDDAAARQVAQSTTDYLAHLAHYYG